MARDEGKSILIQYDDIFDNVKHDDFLMTRVNAQQYKEHTPRACKSFRALFLGMRKLIEYDISSGFAYIWPLPDYR